MAIPIAMFIFPIFLAIMYTLVGWYSYMGYALLLINIFLIQYAVVYISMVLKQIKVIQQEMKQRTVYLKEPEKYPNNIHHLIAIPVYCESLLVIQQTLQVLAEHDRAFEYSILLALEERDVNHDQYAKQLPLFIGKLLNAQNSGGISTYHSPVFKNVFTTIHPIEAIKGKHVNLNYALGQYHTIKSINSLKTLVTVTDVDAHIPNLYIQYINRMYATHNEYIMFAPSAVFAQNPSTVSTLVRVKDASWAIGHMTSLIHPNKVMPLSSYSVPLTLLNEMDYWDLGPVGIGEDASQMLRAVTYTERNGISFDLEAVMIPINYLNVNAGSYWQTIVERYKQGLRHNLAFLMLESSIHLAIEIKTRRMIRLIFNFAECVLMTLIMGWIWFVFLICCYESMTGMAHINTAIMGYYWTLMLMRFNLLFVFVILAFIALFYDVNHYVLRHFKIYGLAKYDKHSILAHFDIAFFPLSCVWLIMAPGLQSAYIICFQQIRKMLGGEYEFVVDASKKQ